MDGSVMICRWARDPRPPEGADEAELEGGRGANWTPNNHNV